MWGTVVAHKCAQNPDVFNEIVIASRTKSKCDAVAKAIGKDNIVTDSVDADNVGELVALFKKHNPDIVINCGIAISGPYHHGCVPRMWRQLS